MNTDQLIHFLTQASHFNSRMQAERNQLVTPKTVKEAAVLVGIVLHEGAWQILLTKRAETLRQHTGQIAFAGGRKDAQDDSLTATALRMDWLNVISNIAKLLNKARPSEKIGKNGF